MSNDSKTTQRDELALDIFLADNSSIPEETLLMDWADAPDQHRPYAQNIADGLIAKGYRKPRTITTVDRQRLVDTLLDYSGTPRNRLFEYPYRADESRELVQKAEATVRAMMNILDAAEANR